MLLNDFQGFEEIVKRFLIFFKRRTQSYEVGTLVIYIIVSC